jgi:hypothetical protein
MKEIIKAINLLDQNGFYKLSDQLDKQLTKYAAFPYNLSNLDELPISARFVTWRRNQEDYSQYDDVFWKELKVRIPDYHPLKTDKDEEKNMEGAIHGDDPVPGPAYVDPGNLASSPSMNGNLDYFTWETAHEQNTGPDYWKNLLPRR